MNHQSPKLTGLIAAPFTPMMENGDVNLAMIDRLAKRLIEDGVAGAFVCGTTGESLSLTVEERKAVAKEWRERAGDRLKVIVHVGHTSQRDAARLAAHAAEIGADAVGAMPPSFFRPAGVRELVDWCAGVAEAAPDVPFYYYHIPSMTGVTLSMTEFLAVAGERIPNLAGIKFTSEDLMEYAACLRFDGGRYNILFGRDEILLAALALGSPGAVGSTYNYAAPIYHDVIRAYKAGDMAAAQAAQDKSIRLVQAFAQYGGLAAQKAIMKWTGIDCGGVRLPLRNLSEDALHELRGKIEALGFIPLAASAVG